MRHSGGGPYLCVHLRRKDFLWARRDDVPSLEGAASQIRQKLLSLDLSTVFVATDAPVHGNNFNSRIHSNHKNSKLSVKYCVSEMLYKWQRRTAFLF